MLCGLVLRIMSVTRIIRSNLIFNKIRLKTSPSVSTNCFKNPLFASQKPEIVDGYISVPDGPGWGTDLNEEVDRKHPWEKAGACW